MKETKFFELYDANPFNLYYVIYMIAERCAGKQTDPDSGETWENYENIDISIVRSIKPMPDAINQNNQVSDLKWEFVKEELVSDLEDSETNPDIESIGNAVKNLPIGKTTSHFFVKVELFN